MESDERAYLISFQASGPCPRCGKEWRDCPCGKVDIVTGEPWKVEERKGGRERAIEYIENVTGEEAIQLREQAAARMVQVLGGVPNPGGLGWDDMLKVADECVRQMEWVRREKMSQVAEREGVYCGSDAPITLAPDGWKP
jgi:hypothetical protein